jgi:hypothetical protein
MNRILNDEHAILYNYYLYAIQRRRLIAEHIFKKFKENLKNLPGHFKSDEEDESKQKEKE